MKIKTSLILLILSSFFLFSCSLSNRIMNLTTQAEDDSPASATSEPITEFSAEPTTTSLSDPDQGFACSHPYLPVVDGASWTYAVNSGEGYTLTIKETGADTFTMVQEMESEGTIFSVEWYCNNDALVQGTFAQVDILNQSFGEGESPFVFETLVFEGATLPAPEMMVLNSTWSSNYELSGQMNLESISGTANVSVQFDHKIGAIESVTTPAGTFPEAIRVDSVGAMDMVMLIAETSAPINSFEFSYSTWYVKGLGMVKSSSTFAGMGTQVELTEASLLN